MRFGKINCCQRLWKAAQSPINRPIWSLWWRPPRRWWMILYFSQESEKSSEREKKIFPSFHSLAPFGLNSRPSSMQATDDALDFFLSLTLQHTLSPSLSLPPLSLSTFYLNFSTHTHSLSLSLSLISFFCHSPIFPTRLLSASLVYPFIDFLHWKYFSYFRSAVTENNTLYFLKNGPISTSFSFIFGFSTCRNESLYGMLGTQTRATGWKAQTNPLCYGGTPRTPLILWEDIITSGQTGSRFVSSGLESTEL